ncbi:MAG: Gldg family protein [Verrucomicrobia bacterium]|nr:Gldg family protein [Verrucomicrobiota bacterium]
MKKPLHTILYSGIGIAAVLALVVALNFLAGIFKQRIDLTGEKAFTLSQGTREILGKLDTPVKIRLYASLANPDMPVILKNYARQVEDLLSEYQQASKGLVTIQKLDPEPDSEAEDSARLDGIDGEQLPNGDRIFLGLSVAMLDQKQSIPFLAPNRERLLEYEITRAISRVATPKKPVVGIMTPLPVSGMGSPMMMAPQSSRPWIIYNELKGDYDVRNIPMASTEIPQDLAVLVVIHPQNISEQAQFAIDQFLLKGGKMVAFLDPASPLQSPNPMMTPGTMPGSTLDKLLPAWGLNFDTSKVVADMTYLAETREGRQPTYLVLSENALSPEDVVTADAGNMVLILGGAFTGQPAEGLKKTVLAKSSKESELIDPMMAQMGGEAIVRSFKPSGIEYDLAIRLTGKFKTAFPNGKPEPATAQPQPSPTPAENKDATALKEATAEASVILFGDSDFMQDAIAVQEFPGPFGQRLVMPANGNLGVVQAAIENLTGDTSLISIRSRASRDRPFTVVRELQAKAESKFRDKIAQLEQGLAETERRLNELQSRKEGASQQFILSPEQQKELENFRKKEAEARKELKLVRRNLRTEIDALETRLKWLNIAAVPAIVALFGTGLALHRKKRSAAK